MKIKITADSTCDLPQDIIDRHNIGIVPLYIVKDDKPYKDRLEISANDIFGYVESGAGMTHSCAVNVAEYQEYFSNWLKDSDAIIHINISESLSVCHGNAVMAAKDFDGRVFVVDSRNLSTGSGHVVYDAALMAESGMRPEEIVEKLRSLVLRVESSFVIGSLKYLHKGGRCSGVAALGANLLRLNPCIEVVQGKMIVGNKYRGSFNKVILQYVEDKLKDRQDIDERRVFVTFPPTTKEQLVSEVVEKVKSLRDFREIICCDAGCVISNHCGPLCLGVLFYRAS